VQSDGTVSARYEYGPFGEPIRETGTFARSNPFRWSTKYWDLETALVYYGYRYYSPGLGRWISRDPIEELDVTNPYVFVRNSNSFIDVDGRFSASEVLVSSAYGAGIGALVNVTGGWMFSRGGYSLAKLRDDFISGAVAGAVSGGIGGANALLMRAAYVGPGTVGYKGYMAMVSGFSSCVGYLAGNLSIGETSLRNNKEGAIGFGTAFALGALLGYGGGALAEHAVESKILDMGLELAGSVGSGMALFAVDAAESVVDFWQNRLVKPILNQTNEP